MAALKTCVLKTAVFTAMALSLVMTASADTVTIGNAPEQAYVYISEAPPPAAADEGAAAQAEAAVPVDSAQSAAADMPVVGEAPAAVETPPETAAAQEAVTAAQEQPETAAPEVQTGSAPEVPQQPEQTAAAPETQAPARTDYVASGPGAALGASSASVTGYEGTAGSAHASDPAVSVSLGFKLASPAVSKGNISVAEGSIQLADGSWAEISHKYNLRAPYYRVLREQVDSAGIPWYICACYATRLGDYRTEDGSIARELWLKKSDCTETQSLNLNTQNELRHRIVKLALSNLGKQYSYAAKGPDAFDCSGFVWYIFNQCGISLPRSSYEICDMEGGISLEELRPGDIVGRYGHVGIYIGDGLFVHSSETNVGVISERLDMYNRTNSFTHYINAVGD